MPALMTRFLKNRAGATAIEFALIGTLVAIAVVSAAALMAEAAGSRDASVQFPPAVTTSLR